MRASRSRSVVLLLDCCYAGAFAQGLTVRAAGDINVLDSFPQERTGGGRGRAVITASNAMEYAFEGNQLADDQHGRPWCSPLPWSRDWPPGTRTRTKTAGSPSTSCTTTSSTKYASRTRTRLPSRQVELEGELYVARSRRRRIRPAPIPPDLQAALTNVSMYARLGAVGELRSRLASENLPVAVGAYSALAELVHTDIRAVADPAAAALAEAAVQPTQTELNFGRVEKRYTVATPDGPAPRPAHRPYLRAPPVSRLDSCGRYDRGARYLGRYRRCGCSAWKP